MHELATNAKYDVFTICIWFIWRGKVDEENRDAESITLLKLMKLLYYAEGCSIAIGNGSLFPDKFEGWAHGPAIKCVWDKYQETPRSLPYSSKDLFTVKSISSVDQDLLEQVYCTFGIYTAWGLRQKSCQETPWIEATNNGKKLNQEICRKSMATYFKEHYVQN